MAVSTDGIPISRSVLIHVTVRLTKQHPVNRSFLRNGAAHYKGIIGLAVLESK